VVGIGLVAGWVELGGPDKPDLVQGGDGHEYPQGLLVGIVDLSESYRTEKRVGSDAQTQIILQNAVAGQVINVRPSRTGLEKRHWETGFGHELRRGFGQR
jgi:hypothetical protein